MGNWVYVKLDIFTYSCKYSSLLTSMTFRHSVFIAALFCSHLGHYKMKLGENTNQ